MAFPGAAQSDNEGPRHRDMGKLGSLACKWVEDALLGKLTDGVDHPANHILNCASSPPGEVRCHDLRLIEQHSVHLGKLPGEFLLAFWCRNPQCRRHVVVRISASEDICSGDVYPMHHLVCTSHAAAQESERSRYNPLLSRAEFECSAVVCSARVVVEVSEPRLPLEYVSPLTDRDRVHARLERLVAEDPERFGEFLENAEKRSRLFPAGYLTQYLADIIQEQSPAKQAGSTGSGPRRKISTRNKIFQICFSGPLEPLFALMEFEKQVDDNGDEFYFAPRLDEPHSSAWTAPDSRRGWLECLFIEADSLSKSFVKVVPWLEIEAPVDSQGYPKLPGQVLGRILGVETYARSQGGGASYAVADCDILGVTRDVHDALLLYAYLCQTQTAPALANMVFETLQTMVGKLSVPSAQLRTFVEEESVRVALALSMQDAQLDPALPPGAPGAQGSALYQYFNLDPACDDRQVLESYKVHLQSSPGRDSQIKHRDALMKIGKERGSAAIMDRALDFPTLQAALEYLGVELASGADFIVSAVSVLVDEAGGEGKDRDLVAQALRIVAKQIEYGELLNAKADEITQAPGTSIIVKSEPSVRMDLPTGLVNLRNTCYLNSILQYFFTIKVVRDVVQNRDVYRLEPTDENLKQRLLAGSPSPLERGEAYLSQRFIDELGELFHHLQSSTDQAVRPKQSMAIAALKTADALTEIGKTRLESIQKEKAAAADKDQAPPPLPARRSPAPPTLPPRDKATAPTATTPTVTVNAVSDQVETGSDVSSQTLVNQTEEDIEQNYVSIVDKTAGGNADVSAPSPSVQMDETKEGLIKAGSLSETVTDDMPGLIEISDDEDERPVDVKMEDVDSPEPAVEDKIAAALDDNSTSGTNQEDVEEVMGNILGHLSAAIKPTGTDDVTGAQTDAITDTFYWTSVKHLRNIDATGKPTSQFKRKFEISRWMTAFPIKQGPTGSRTIDLYEALDMSFDQEFQEDGLEQYTSIFKAPRIAHVYIQRSQNDRTKNAGHVEIPEVLYLDRYMDSEERSELYKRRLRGWNLKRRLGSLHGPNQGVNPTQTDDADWVALPDKEQRMDMFDAAGDEESVGVIGSEDGFAVLGHRSRKAVTAQDAPANDARTDSSEDVDMGGGPDDSGISAASRDASRKTEEERRALEDERRKEFSELFADMKQHPYRLHAVICHGGAKLGFGHYWAWIYDFEQKVWRKYNDTEVTVEPDSKVVLEKLKNSPDPYYISYVREDEIDSLVSIPRRLQQDAGPAPEGRDVDMHDAVMAEHVEHGDPPPYSV